MVDRQRASVTFRLNPGIAHQHVPGSRGAAHHSPWFWTGEQFRLGYDFLFSAGLAGLFGFKYEATPFVKVDPPGAGRSIERRFLHRAFENVIIFQGNGGGGLRSRDADRVE